MALYDIYDESFVAVSTGTGTHVYIIVKVNLTTWEEYQLEAGHYRAYQNI